MPRKKPPTRRAYDTDLSDGQWALIEPMIPVAEPGGRPRKAATRDLVDAILYFLRSGGGWRLLPHDLPPWQTVYYYLRRWRSEGAWDRGHHADRERAGREANRTAPCRRSCAGAADLQRRGRALRRRLPRAHDRQDSQAARLPVGNRRGQDGDPRALEIRALCGIECHFLHQGSRRPVDCPRRGTAGMRASC